MDRIRRFQRSLITVLVGINSFVFSISSDIGVAKSFLFAFSAMLIALLFIMSYIILKKRFDTKRISHK